jgi:hypothetical protein
VIPTTPQRDVDAPSVGYGVGNFRARRPGKTKLNSPSTATQGLKSITRDH